MNKYLINTGLLILVSIFLVFGYMLNNVYLVLLSMFGCVASGFFITMATILEQKEKVIGND